MQQMKTAIAVLLVGTALAAGPIPNMHMPGMAAMHPMGAVGLQKANTLASAGPSAAPAMGDHMVEAPSQAAVAPAGDKAEDVAGAPARSEGAGDQRLGADMFASDWGVTNDGGVQKELAAAMDDPSNRAPVANCAGKYGPVIDPLDVHCWWFCLGRGVGDGDMGIRQCCLLPFNCFNVPTPLFPLGYCFPCSNAPPNPPPPSPPPPTSPPPIVVPAPPPPPVVVRSCPVPAPVVSAPCGTNISSTILVFNATATDPTVTCQATFFNIPGYASNRTYPCTQLIFGRTCDNLGGYLYIYMGTYYPLGPSSIINSYMQTLGIADVKQVFGLYISKDGAFKGSLQPTFLGSLERIVYGGISVTTDETLGFTNDPRGSGLTVLPGLTKLSSIGGVLYIYWTSFPDLQTFSGLACISNNGLDTLGSLSLANNGQLTTLSPLNLGAPPDGVSYTWSLPEFAKLTDIRALRSVSNCLPNLQSSNTGKIVIRLASCYIQTWGEYCVATAVGNAAVCPA